MFAQTNDKSVLANIGRVACREFTFDNLNEINPVPVNNLRSQFASDQEYLAFINDQSLNGVECKGDEVSVKECQAKGNATLKTTLYEIEVECMCKSK